MKSKPATRRRTVVGRATTSVCNTSGIMLENRDRAVEMEARIDLSRPLRLYDDLGSGRSHGERRRH